MAKALNPSSQQQGLSLVELMIALAISLVIIAAATSIFGSTAGANSTQMKISRLNNELRAAMSAITRDMRRAGYHAWSAASLTAGDFDVSPQSLPAITTNPTTGTISVSYDLDSNGQRNTYGFSLDASGAIVASVGGSSARITDPAVVRITKLSVIDLSPADINVSGTGSTVSSSCLNKSGVVVNTTTSSRTVSVPTYQLEIAGELVSDTSIKRSVREVVRVRNVVVTC